MNKYAQCNKKRQGLARNSFHTFSHKNMNTQLNGVVARHMSRGSKNFKGFTLLEMVVAVGVFAVAAILGVSSYLALTGAQKKALTLQSIQDNLRFVTESMARDIRVGNFYYCGVPPSINPPPWNSAVSPQRLPWSPQNCDSEHTAGGTALTFVRGANTVVVYRSRDCDGNGHYCIERGEASGMMPPESVFVPMTSRDVEIGSADPNNPGLLFFVVGSGHGDLVPGRVTMYIHGTARAGKQESTFDIQTTVAQLQLFRGLQ